MKISGLWKDAAAVLTGPFLAALLLSAGFLAFVAWDQSHWWIIKQDYQFGWLVPALAGYVIYDRWPQITAAIAACMAEGSPRAAGWQKWLLRLLAGAAMLFGAMMFLLGSFYRAGAGTSQPGTLAITMGAAAILLPLLFVNAPVPGEVGQGASDTSGLSKLDAEVGAVALNRPGQHRQERERAVEGNGPYPKQSAQSPIPNGRWSDKGPVTSVGLFSDPRVRLVALFVFPVLVWLVSAPMVSAIESQLSLFLLHKVVSVVAFVYIDVLGLPIEQQGNVLALPGGTVGVEDACSGIRSLTASLFAGSFLAAVFLEKLWKKITLVAVSMVFVFLANLARSLFLTAWAYSKGPGAIEGAVHDIAGYAVLGLTFGGLVGLVWLFNLKLAPEKTPAQAEPGD